MTCPSARILRAICGEPAARLHVAARLSSCSRTEAPRHGLRRPADDEPPTLPPRACRPVSHRRSPGVPARGAGSQPASSHRTGFPGPLDTPDTTSEVDPRHTVVDVRARSLHDLGKERWQVADIDDSNRDRHDDVEGHCARRLAGSAWSDRSPVRSGHAHRTRAAPGETASDATNANTRLQLNPLAFGACRSIPRRAGAM